MAALVDSILQAEQDKQASYKSIDVYKVIDPDIDEGLLLAADPNHIDKSKYR